MPNKRFGALSSSVNPQELSLTVQSTLKLVLGLLVAFGYMNTVQMDSFVEQVPALVTLGYVAWQALEALWGAIRKLIYTVFPTV